MASLDVNLEDEEDPALGTLEHAMEKTWRTQETSCQEWMSKSGRARNIGRAGK